MDSEELRHEFNDRALDVIREAAYGWESYNEDADDYPERIHYIQGVLEMVTALEQILHDSTN